MSENSPLIEAPKRRGPAIALAVAVLLVVGALVAFALTRGDDSAGDDLTKVKLGVVGASDPYWKTLKDEAKDEGIDLEVVDFADYPQPNPALTEGEIDINQFQHIVYLADYNVANDQDLTPIGSTAIYPLGLYSQKVDSVEDIKSGDTVVVPDDDSNQARALGILQSAGLIKLKDGGSIFSTLADIDKDASKVKVKAIKADLTPTSLPDVAAAIVNNDFVEKAGLKFEDAIAKDDPSDPNAVPYINIFAVRAEDKDNKTYAKLVEVYQNSKKVQDGVQDIAAGTAELLKTPVADLEASLAKVEADTRARG
ncbi:methionine ABC transporter substrate-binding protein [Aeromicrobium sp. 636]|uniref:MetQ/NlpA family ABC transporter substrate-binding protein n=1 Tax=Aeromicrobium TaxID=2040 RepID=UPI00137F3451|nr:MULTISPECIES: MetQ/NlpA family ABC transporter substrate-binding protein [Aeromicrobium]MCQ3997924.1 methionine ABC transporter substrate-binding protein [Aeromicrobium sp. 636]MTB87852.1 methionine ABC transporter substrate-binding protein [Aeromicrobium senzhongii]